MATIYDKMMTDEDDHATIIGECLPMAGDPFPVETDVSLRTDEDGTFDGTSGMVQDVTELLGPVGALQTNASGSRTCSTPLPT